MPAYSFEGPVWNTDTITWSFIQFIYPNDPAFDSQITPGLESTITAAFDKWESVDPSLNFVNVPDSSDESQAADIRVGFADLSTITGEIGETDPKATANGVNFAPDTLIRLEDPADLKGLTANASGLAEYTGTQTTLYQVALHEIGHALGLGHSTVDGGDPSSIMFPTVGPNNPDLDATDIAAIDILYPPPQPAPTPTPTPPPTVSGGTTTVQQQTPTPTPTPIFTPVPTGPTDLFTDNGISSAITTDDSANTVVGSTGNDTITTGTGTNLIVPGSGSDLILAQGTDTILPGAGGVDTVFAVGHVIEGVGAGTLFFINGQNTSTVIGGGAGNAVINGGSGGGLFAAGAGGGSLVFAGTGASTVFGVANGDVLFAGGSAPDLLLAGGGNETLSGIGSTGGNVLRGGSGNDLIGGGAGAETFYAGLGSDTFLGGSGADLYAFANGDAGGSDLVVGFDPGKGDRVSLQGYGPDAVSTALARADRLRRGHHDHARRQHQHHLRRRQPPERVQLRLTAAAPPASLIGELFQRRTPLATSQAGLPGISLTTVDHHHRDINPGLCSKSARKAVQRKRRRHEQRSVRGTGLELGHHHLELRDRELRTATENGVDPPFSTQIDGGTQGVIADAFAAWARVDPSLRFVNVADAVDPGQAADIRVGFADLENLSSSDYGTTDLKVAADGAHFLPDTLIQLEDPRAVDGTTGAGDQEVYAGPSSLTLYQVALHQIGLALGLAPSSDPNSIMYTNLSASNVTLDANDIAAIDVLYPPPDPPPTPPPPTVTGGTTTTPPLHADPTPTPTPTGPTHFFTDNGVSSVITTDNTANTVVGSIGNDTITTGTGTNLIVPGSGSDIIVAHGTDTILPGAGGVDTVFAVGHVIEGVGAGTLFFINGQNTSTVIGGGTGNAFINGGSGGGLFAAGAGGGSLVFAGTGASTVFGVANGDVLFAGGSAPDLLLAGGGNETLTGIGSTGANVLRGGSGNDLIGGGAGAETFYAGLGSDTFLGGSGADLYVFADGDAGGRDLVVGFYQGKGDLVSLQGYGPDAVSTVLAQQTASGAGTTITLGDNTSITFAGVSHLTASDFA